VYISNLHATCQRPGSLWPRWKLVAPPAGPRASWALASCETASAGPRPGLGTGRRLGPALGSPLRWARPHRDGHGPGRTPARGGPPGRGAGRGIDRDRDGALTGTATATSEAASGSLRSLLATAQCPLPVARAPASSR
jgi:hypothetical protein